MLHIVVKPFNTIQTEPFTGKLGPSNLVDILLMTRGRTLLIFKVKSQGHILNIVVKSCEQGKKTFYIASYDIISHINSPIRRILQRLSCSCSSLKDWNTET